MKETPLFIPQLTEGVTVTAQCVQFESFYQEFCELVKKHDLKFVTTPAPPANDLVDTLMFLPVAEKKGELQLALRKSRRVGINQWFNENGEPLAMPFPVNFDADPRIEELVKAHGYTKERAKNYLHIRDQLAEREAKHLPPVALEPPTEVVVTRVGRIMTQFKCSLEDAQRYIDYRDDGHSQHAAAVMAGIADPAE